MVPAWSYEQVCRELGEAFRSHNAGIGTGKTRMVGLLFAPPEVKLAKDEIVTSLGYFHHRSGAYIDFFCAGYSRYGRTSGARPVSDDDPPWMFSTEEYHRFQKEIEHLSQWRYSGEADLLLLNAVRSEENQKVSLDFSTAIVCDLDYMIEHGAIRSVRRFFEDIARFAESYNNADDPTFRFSDQMGARSVGSALMRVILTLLPKDIGKDFRRPVHFVIRDLSARR